MWDRYGEDVLAKGWRERSTPKLRELSAERGMVLERSDDGFCGEIVALGASEIHLEDRFNKTRVFPYGSGFLYEGEAVIIGKAAPVASAQSRTASGSIAAKHERAKTAIASRILVEGRHDAELIEKVWGDDLRYEGVVVEYLSGADDLLAILDSKPPSAEKRFGVLLDHLKPGTKEQKIADAVAQSKHGAHTLILGHPFIDIWQCIKAEVLGFKSWPEVPRGEEWKKGVLRRLGAPADDQADIAKAWQWMLSRVNSYRDLEPELLSRVEALIDFVTVPPSDSLNR